MFTTDYWREALNRAWRTFFQTVIAGGAVQLFTEDWGAALATAGIAAAISVIQFFADPPAVNEPVFDPDIDSVEDAVDELDDVDGNEPVDLEEPVEV